VGKDMKRIDRKYKIPHNREKIDQMIAIKRMFLLSLVIFSGWLFFWPLTESWYAQSFYPVFSNQFKMFSFFIGAIVFWIGDYILVKNNWNNGIH
jgi:hypothetical protein